MIQDKKNICIISSYTFIKKTINYGALFQYFALEKYLEKEGYKPYWLKYIVKEKLSIKLILKNTIKRIVKPWYYIKKDKNHNKFLKFVDQNLCVSDKEYFGVNDLVENLPKADVFITGSDQVWGGCDKANYLTFVPEKRRKIAYAASFGKKNISIEQKDIITPWLRNINKISVREKSGVAICENMGINAVLTVDPTFLVDPNTYPSIKPIEKEFSFAYFLNVDINRALELSNACKKYLNKESTFLCTAGVSEMDRVLSSRELKFLSPQEWIGMYKEAKIIFTNTFHGTAFALIFHKSFVVFKQNGMSKKQNERLISLLETYSLEDRICENLSSLNKIVNSPINWDKFEEIKKLNVEKSEEFLRESINKGVYC